MSDSESDEDNVIKYGTPLEPYEEDEIPSKRKFQQPSDQYAVDDHGRRRFHGAFTGGFSAGYGNSVGTPEGWTPASFKSSRMEKAKISNQRPEDYMDDEDRGEFGIAPQILQTHTEFSGQKRQRQRYHDGPIPGEPVLHQLVRAVHETAAVKLLRRMGWRPGAGVGDRQRARPPRHKGRVYGCHVPPEMRQEQPGSASDGSDSESDSEFEYDALFAPEEGAGPAAPRKCDCFGLGYSGLSRHSVLGGAGRGAAASHLLMKDKGKRVSIRGQAFGVGALEADDADIYARDDLAQYDFAIGGPPPPAPPAPAAHTRQPQSGAVLEGFARARKPERAAARYPPPALPRDYRPAPARASRFQPPPPGAAPPRDQGLGRHELSAAARGALLGETPVPRDEARPPPPRAAPPVKIIDFTSAGAGPATQSEDFIPLGGSGAPPRVFRPFAADLAKQARYERYLAGARDACEGDGADALAAWERDREMREFEQAAKLYRPLTGAMSDRFTHAAAPDDTSPLAAVARSAAGGGPATPQQADAAARGVYGVMTRARAAWRPEPLVCKRFNVPELGAAGSDQVKQDKPKVSYSIFSYLESSVHDRESFTKEQTKFSGSKSLADAAPAPAGTATSSDSSTKRADEVPAKSGNYGPAPNKRVTVAELFLQESEKALESSDRVEEAIEKFDKMDLYKSIFLSDSEPEEEVKGPESFEVRPQNTERNTSPPRGIFAGIDFDQLNSWKRSDGKPDAHDKDEGKTNEPADAANANAHSVGGEKSSDTNSQLADKTTGSNAIDAAMYGPRIPDDLQQRIASESRPVFQKVRKESSSSDSWVDASEVRKKHKNKKHKKHKSKHKKAKHKKKKDK